MSWRPHGHAEVDPDWPRAWATCDRCGFLYNHYKLQWQYEWAGFSLINKRLLVCETCLDKPAEFLRAVVIPSDPKPVFNARSVAHFVDETDWLSSEASETIETESGNPMITETGGNPENP